ncbi:hypothetical protein K443DRAFT_257814 [Laccaria amethystina LaAM-08-1]|jgi:hypothetical protein|uniref:Uncharacterized protein n=1 Tax=Laccaria amethystina LaAM-08-1 TaxID=1095629 RepID=A0A0C9X727_9AGAR|nr:hypothetical protein K443DRAFT_257814 [Laccaria amethystina LaAM-08-1]
MAFILHHHCHHHHISTLFGPDSLTHSSIHPFLPFPPYPLRQSIKVPYHPHPPPHVQGRNYFFTYPTPTAHNSITYIEPSSLFSCVSFVIAKCTAPFYHLGTSTFRDSWDIYFKFMMTDNFFRFYLCRYVDCTQYGSSLLH